MKNKVPDRLTIQQYLEGTLDEKLMHQLEKRALEDPFLADALEGYSHVSEPGHGLSILQRQLHERIAHQQENKKVFDLSWQRLSVAAAAAVMFISAGLLFWMNSNNKPDPGIAKQDHKQVEVILAPKVTGPEEIKQAPIPVENNQDQKIAAARTVKLKKPVVADTVSSTAVTSITATRMPDSFPALSEIVVTKTASVNNEKIMSARSSKVSPVQISRFNAVADNPVQPLEGWELYRKYIAEGAVKFNTVPALQGKVWVSFRVYSDGTLHDFKILSGLNEAYNNEAIRLIKTGPQWQTPPSAVPAEVKVEVVF